MPRPTKQVPTVWLNLTEAAEYARLSPYVVSRAAAGGKLSGVKPQPEKKNSKWLFRTTDIDAWLEGNRVAS